MGDDWSGQSSRGFWAAPRSAHGPRRPAPAKGSPQTRPYAEALASDPTLADDSVASNRYDAACAAALAATGRDEPAAKLEADERVGLRRQALDGLRADLSFRAKRLESTQPDDRQAVEPLRGGGGS